MCILSIDGGGRAADGLLAGAALARLESSLRTRSGDPSARISDFFDVLAGSGAGGVLACMLSARSPHGRPLFSAEEALQFLIKNLKKTWSKKRKGLIFRNSSGRVKSFKKLFGEMTLKDTVRPVLVPCYDLTTGSPFLFSRADAIENEGYDFKVREVCEATCCDGIDGGIEAKSVDGKRRVVAVGGGVAMGNPTAAAITHVLNNKKEFPLAGGVDDLLVVSIGSSDAGCPKAAGEASEGEIVRIAAEGVADMVSACVYWLILLVSIFCFLIFRFLVVYRCSPLLVMNYLKTFFILQFGFWHLVSACLDIEFSKVIKHVPDRKFLAFLFPVLFSFLLLTFLGLFTKLATIDQE